MRIGFDIDGVLADFSKGFMGVLRQTSGRDLFSPGDDVDAPCWDWDKFRGYTKEERVAAWSHIQHSDSFWMGLEPLDNVSTLRTMLRELERKHEVYYLTQRMGQRVKRQTEIWLTEHLRYPLVISGVYPTVLITGSRTKGEACRILGLDAYVDDNYDNVHDVVSASPATRTYLRTRRYNKQTMVTLTDREPNVLKLVDYPPVDPRITRVTTLGDMFDYEIDNEYL